MSLSEATITKLSKGDKFDTTLEFLGTQFSVCFGKK